MKSQWKIIVTTADDRLLIDYNYFILGGELL